MYNRGSRSESQNTKPQTFQLYLNHRIFCGCIGMTIHVLFLFSCASGPSKPTSESIESSNAHTHDQPRIDISIRFDRFDHPTKLTLKNEDYQILSCEISPDSWSRKTWRFHPEKILNQNCDIHEDLPVYPGSYTAEIKMKGTPSNDHRNATTTTQKTTSTLRLIIRGETVKLHSFDDVPDEVKLRPVSDLAPKENPVYMLRRPHSDKLQTYYIESISGCCWIEKMHPEHENIWFGVPGISLDHSAQTDSFDVFDSEVEPGKLYSLKANDTLRDTGIYRFVVRFCSRRCPTLGGDETDDLSRYEASDRFPIK